MGTHAALDQVTQGSRSSRSRSQEIEQSIFKIRLHVNVTQYNCNGFEYICSEEVVRVTICNCHCIKSMISTVYQYVIATVTMFDCDCTRCSITTVCKQEAFFVKVSKAKVKSKITSI